LSSRRKIISIKKQKAKMDKGNREMKRMGVGARISRPKQSQISVPNSIRCP
jgi:hypothetical protein